ncbi:M15 family metallopeptidase [Streptomyces sp. NPDC002536]
MDEIVLMCDPRVAAIGIQECGEPLVDVRRSTLLVDDSRSDAQGAFAHLREGVLERLVTAQAGLPEGLRLLVVEGYRPLALQARYFEEYAAALRALNPAWSEDEVRAGASRYVAPPEIGPHTAGAAVDITLADAGGRELDLGTRTNSTPEESDGACYTAAVNISSRSRELRQVLGAALASAGLVNYPSEWWHWSYGDQYWALTTGGSSARYGPCALPLQGR